MPPVVLVGFGFVLLTLVAILTVGLANLRTVHETNDAVAHSRDVEAGLRELLATVVEAQTSARGFIITGVPAQLEPYDRARAALKPALARMRASIAGDADQQASLDRLSAASDVKLRELAVAIQTRRDSGFAAAQGVVEADIDRRTLDGMRDIVARMEAREDALLVARVARAGDSYRRARLFSYIMTIAACLIVAALFFMTHRAGMDRLRAIETALRFKVTLASISDAVITTDDQGRMLRMNPTAENLTGWTEADASGRPADDILNLIDQESRHPIRNPVRRLIEEGQAVGLGNRALLVAKDGREIPVEDSAGPIRTADGLLTGVVIVFRDVTARREAERQRAAMVEAERRARLEADHANRSKDQFLAILSHELRTPLGVILGWADLLRRNALDEAGRQRAANAIHDNAARQAQMIDDLLDVARITSGKLRLARRSVDWATLSRSVVEAAQPAAEAKGICITRDVDCSLGPFYGDPDRLNQVLLNLVFNAIKFTPAGGSIQVRLRGVEDAVELEVADTGRGIDPALLPFIFEPFRQGDTPNTLRHGGLGLGLSIVKHLVEAHGGTISASSPGEGQGATFLVRLPVVRPA